MKGKVLLVLLAFFMVMGMAGAQEGSTDGAAQGGMSDLKFLGAGLAVGLSGIGAGYAIGKVGVAASGAIAENPKLFGNTILYVAFGEAIAIYGLLVALLVIG